MLSIDVIEFHIKSIHTFADYENNITITDAVERRLAVIGEAMNQINKKDKTILITNKSRIINLRHILIHEYDLIEDATIWNIIFNHLPILKNEVSILLNSTT